MYQCSLCTNCDQTFTSIFHQCYDSDHTSDQISPDIQTNIDRCNPIMGHNGEKENWKKERKREILVIIDTSDLQRTCMKWHCTCLQANLISFSIEMNNMMYSFFSHTHIGLWNLYLKTHNGEKSHKCSQCDYASSEAGHFRLHLNIHICAQSNKCNQCDYSSTQVSHLRTYISLEESQRTATNVTLHLFMKLL